jgi:hypothetical protein
MSTQWFYERDGQKHGPVPAATLRHLAECGGLTPATNVWQGDMKAPVPAVRVKNLFPNAVLTPQNNSPEPTRTVADYLTETLNACRDEDEDRLKNHVPRLMSIHPFSIGWILLEFEIMKIVKLPTPIHDPSLPLGQRTKPVRQLFDATVSVVLCTRPKYRGSLDEVRRLQVGRREDVVVYECKEFMDGDWIFMDVNVAR